MPLQKRPVNYKFLVCINNTLRNSYAQVDEKLHKSKKIRKIETITRFGALKTIGSFEMSRSNLHFLCVVTTL